jgi:hypothetical protein
MNSAPSRLRNLQTAAELGCILISVFGKLSWAAKREATNILFTVPFKLDKKVT